MEHSSKGRRMKKSSDHEDIMKGPQALEGTGGVLICYSLGRRP